jgi:hypothetical protein
MLSYPYLLAKADTLSRLLTKYLTPEYSNKEDCLYVEPKDKTDKVVRLSIKQMPDALICKALHTYDNHKTVQSIRGKKESLTLEQWVWEYVLDEIADKKISGCQFKGGVVTYQLGTTSLSIPVDKSTQERDYQNLIAIESLKQGYTFREIKGSHFEVYPYKGIPVATSAFTCTCTEYERNGVCLHLHTVKAILNQKHRRY